MDYIVLSNGVKLPQLGYGVYQVTKEEKNWQVKHMSKKVLILSGSPRKGENVEGAIEKGIIYGTGVYHAGEIKGKKLCRKPMKWAK